MDSNKSKKNQKNGLCPLREMLTRLGDKWSILIICTLAEAPQSKLRFSELKKEINGISQRMLTATLRNLERDGLVKRKIYAEVPPRVEYELTALGRGILEPMQGLIQWIEGHWSKIDSSRAAFDKAAV